MHVSSVDRQAIAELAQRLAQKHLSTNRVPPMLMDEVVDAVIEDREEDLQAVEDPAARPFMSVTAMSALVGLVKAILEAVKLSAEVWNSSKPKPTKATDPAVEARLKAVLYDNGIPRDKADGLLKDLLQATS